MSERPQADLVDAVAAAGIAPSHTAHAESCNMHRESSCPHCPLSLLQELPLYTRGNGAVCRWKLKGAGCR
jgi:hypothetical protein